MISLKNRNHFAGEDFEWYRTPVIMVSSNCSVLREEVMEILEDLVKEGVKKEERPYASLSLSMYSDEVEAIARQKPFNWDGEYNEKGMCILRLIRDYIGGEKLNPGVERVLDFVDQSDIDYLRDHFTIDKHFWVKQFHNRIRDFEIIKLREGEPDIPTAYITDLVHYKDYVYLRDLTGDSIEIYTIRVEALEPRLVDPYTQDLTKFDFNETIEYDNNTSGERRLLIEKLRSLLY